MPYYPYKVRSLTPEKMPHRITFQVKTITRDSLGSPIPSWTDLATVWAEVMDITGREFWEAQKTNSEVTTRIRIWYRAGIKPDMRIIFGNRKLEIVAVIPDVKRREMQLMCQEWVS